MWLMVVDTISVINSLNLVKVELVNVQNKSNVVHIVANTSQTLTSKSTNWLLIWHHFACHAKLLWTSSVDQCHMKASTSILAINCSTLNANKLKEKNYKKNLESTISLMCEKWFREGLEKP